MSKNDEAIVVVGAAGGIGLEVVKQLLPSYQVFAMVLDQNQAAQVTNLGVSHAIPCDISSEQAVEDALGRLNKCLPDSGVTALIYCAAIQPVAAIELMERKELEKLFAINLFGTMQVVRGLIPSLRKSKGRIVLFSSLLGRITTPMVGGYSSTKFALEALANALRLELDSSGISVSLIEPGGVKTAMASAQPKLVEDALQRLSGHDQARYAKLYRAYANSSQKLLKNASAPERIASVAVQAATGPKKPRARYLVGSDAKMTIGLSRILPASWLDRLFVRLFS